VRAPAAAAKAGGGVGEEWSSTVGDGRRREGPVDLRERRTLGAQAQGRVRSGPARAPDEEVRWTSSRIERREPRERPEEEWSSTVGDGRRREGPVELCERPERARPDLGLAEHPSSRNSRRVRKNRSSGALRDGSWPRSRGAPHHEAAEFASETMRPLMVRCERSEPRTIARSACDARAERRGGRRGGAAPHAPRPTTEPARTSRP
jgi:hypothetical protein